MSEHDGGLDLDEKLKELRDLPDVPLPPIVSTAVRRKARIAFLESGAPAPGANEGEVRVAVWTRTVLPLLLLVVGAAYTVSSIAAMGQVYLRN